LVGGGEAVAAGLAVGQLVGTSAQLRWPSTGCAKPRANPAEPNPN